MGNDFMSLLKKFFILSLYLIFQNAFGYVCVNATSNYKMFGSVLRENVLKNPFVMAFSDEHFKNYKIFSADNDTQLVEQIQQMTSGGECAFVLGLFTSQDCLVSGPILKKNKTIGLSSSCSNNRIDAFFPYIYTVVPKLSDFSKVVAKNIDVKNANVIYAFYQPSDVYSYSGFAAFRKYFKNPVVGVPVGSDGNFDLNLLNVGGKNKYTIIFFTYPLPSAQILVRLDSRHFINKKVNIVGASSWIFDVSVFRPIKSILLKANSVLTPSLIDQRRIYFSNFAHRFVKLYDREPDVVEVLTYDITRIAVQCYRKTRKTAHFSNEAFLHCIKQNKYDGVSGYTTFEKESPFSSKKIYLIHFISRV